MKSETYSPGATERMAELPVTCDRVSKHMKERRSKALIFLERLKAREH